MSLSDDESPSSGCRLPSAFDWLYLEARVVDWFVPVLRIRNVVTAKFVFYIN